MAFTQEERTAIRRKLLETARQCAATLGVRKTTVDQLVEAADISKGAFYQFYASKECIFLDVLEQLHTEIYGVAEQVLAEAASLSPADRVSKAVLAACSAMEETGMMAFMERDVPYILRKVPDEILKGRYHSDAVHIHKLLEQTGFIPAVGLDLAAATVQGLLLTVSHRGSIGEPYSQVLEILVCGACEKLFPAQAAAR